MGSSHSEEEFELQNKGEKYEDEDDEEVEFG